MKKPFILLASFGVAALMLLNSCEPEVVNPPNLQVTPSETVAAVPGDDISYQSIISSDTDLTSFEVTVKIGEVLVAMADTVFPENIQSAIISFPFNVPDTITVATTITLSFEARNADKNAVETRTIDVTIPFRDINTYTAVILSDIENPTGSSFFSLENNQLMQLTTALANSEKVDIIYYYGVTNKATLCAPADTDVEIFTDKNNTPIVTRFPTRNNTKLAAVTMTEAEFNAIVNDGPITQNTPATTSTAVTKLAIGNVLFAVTAGGKKSLILVKNIIGTQGTSEITIEVKIQQ